MLHKVLVAPLAGEVRLRPLVEDIQQSQVVPTRGEEILSGGVRMHDLVLWAVEDGIVDWEHGCNGDDLMRALVPESGKQGTDELNICCLQILTDTKYLMEHTDGVIQTLTFLKTANKNSHDTLAYDKASYKLLFSWR